MASQDGREIGNSYGPHALLAALIALMIWIRTRSSSRVVKDSVVYFSGNDPWYHARMVHYIVRYFPSSPNLDPYSFFPYGTGRHSGFGSLFDQLIALVALMVGGGNPDPHLIEVVTAYAPVAFGALTAIPVYLIAKRLMDRWWGILSVIFLALVNGQFLTRTVVGVSDHQSAEAFFGSLAFMGFIYAITVAYLEKPTLADLQDQNWRVLKRPTLIAVGGGVSIAAYLMTWGPGVFLVFTMGSFVVIQIVRDHLDGIPTEYLVYATVVSSVTAALLTLAYAKSYDLSATAFSLLQPLVLVGITVGALALWYLSEYFRQERYDSWYYPVAVGGLIVGVLIVIALMLPSVFEKFESLIVRIYSFGLLTSPTSLTVAEIAPATPSDAWHAYTGLFPIAIIGFLLLAYRVLRENRPMELLIVLWSLTIASAYFTMIRFGYYMGVTVALLASYAVWWTASLVDLDEMRTLSDLETYQIIVFFIVVVAILPGNVIAVGGTSAPAWETAERVGGTNTAWHGELAWMNENTPEVPIEYYGQFERADNRDFEYPSSAYGVMSWWDYGHWITYTAERIPNANPFQQGPRPASAYLLGQNESRANLILEALPSVDSGSEIEGMSNKELRAVIEDQSSQQANEDTKYVVIDDQMAAGKFSAIATWTGPGPGAFFSRQEFEVADTTARLLGTNDRYRNTMLARLYYDDTSGLEHYRLVHESERKSTIVSVAQEGPNGYERTSIVNQRLSQSVFQAVQQRPDLGFYNVRQESTVKVYERVPGATVTGQVDTENATSVFATVRLQTNVGRNFTYIQTVETDDQGNFEVTVPYATTNNVDPADGGTDSGVTALGKYELFAGNPFQPIARGNLSVPEPALYEESRLTVEMEPVAEPRRNESDGTTSENETTQPPGNETSDDNSTNSSNESALRSPDSWTFTASTTGPTLAETSKLLQPFRARDG